MARETDRFFADHRDRLMAIAKNVNDWDHTFSCH